MLLPSLAMAGRAGLREPREAFSPLAPLNRDIRALRSASPSADPDANVHLTAGGNFRILWGDEYPRGDSDWKDTDGDGLPEWIEIIAEAFETALSLQQKNGFSLPYGMDRYSLDVYVGNTGMSLYDWDEERWKSVEIQSNYYAYTEIDKTHETAYFVFNSDLSSLAADEKALIKATAAHELFHAVQRNDFPWDDETWVDNRRWGEEAWWFEATATWIEEVCQPQVNDYVYYVQDLLSRPYEPLTWTNGYREYGLAILAGHLWQNHGGPQLWRRIFKTALDLGVEGAIQNALAETGQPSFENIMAGFWTLAAHPDDLWEDGHLFYGENTPRLAASVSALPESLLSGNAGITNPGRYGAILYRVTDTPSAISVRLIENETAAKWRAGFSQDGDTLWRAEPLAENLPASFAPAGEGFIYIAVVNTSDGAGEKRLDAEAMRSALAPDTSAKTGNRSSSSGGGGGGGCFIKSLLPLH